MRDAGLLAPVWAGTAITGLVDDDAWVAAMVETEIALAVAQGRIGMIPESVAPAIIAATRRGLPDAETLARAARGGANPVVAFVTELTGLVAAVDPDSANYVHCGSTSQDILDTAAMLICTRALGLIRDRLGEVADALAELVDRHRDTPAVARTLGTHAVPTTFGARAASWLTVVLDAHERVQHLADGVLPLQLGGAAGTLAAYIESGRGAGADYPDAAHLCAALSAEFALALGLSDPITPWHTVRTPFADVGAALAVTTGALGKVATDVITLSRNEISEVSEGLGPGRGESSAMPQKRNPALSALIRSAAMQVPALITVLYNAMLAEDERPAGAWHAEWAPLREALLLVGGAAETAVELCTGLTVDTDRMAANLALTDGQVASERLSAVLAPLLGKIKAKQLLAKATATATVQRRPLAAVLHEEPTLTACLSRAEITELLAPENYLGLAPAIADAALLRFRKTVAVR